MVKNNKHTQSKTRLDMSIDSEKIVSMLSDLAEKSVIAYTPLVDEIIRLEIKDKQRIEFTLDYILGACFGAKIG